MHYPLPCTRLNWLFRLTCRMPCLKKCAGSVTRAYSSHQCSRRWWAIDRDELLIIAVSYKMFVEAVSCGAAAFNLRLDWWLIHAVVFAPLAKSLITINTFPFTESFLNWWKFTPINAPNPGEESLPIKVWPSYSSNQSQLTGRAFFLHAAKDSSPFRAYDLKWTELR